MRVTIIPIVIGAFGKVTKGLLNGLEEIDVGGRVENIQTENGENTEKSPVDLRTLPVTQTLVNDQQLSLMRKTLISKKKKIR